MSVLKYKIDRIVTKDFWVTNVTELNKLKLSLSFQFKVSSDDKIICCISHYEYERETERLMHLDLECYFQIDHDYFSSLIEDEVLTIKPDILQYLATIAVGAARGEIHARCDLAGSILKDTVLPPVDLTKIIQTPAVFAI